jgi:hypothetical protein
MAKDQVLVILLQLHAATRGTKRYFAAARSLPLANPMPLLVWRPRKGV